LLSGFAIVFFAGLVVGLIQGTKPFYADSGDYWHLAKTFTNHGSFSLLHFEYTGLRGYALPLTYFVLRGIGNLFVQSRGAEVVVFNAALIALLSGTLAPRLAKIVWPQHRWGLPQALALGALFLIFWSGYLSFPLSDLPALVAATVAVIAVSRTDSPLWLGLAGAAAAYALDARPAYLLLVPLIGLIALRNWWTRDPAPPPSMGRRALCAVAFVTGLAIVSVPQSIVSNHAGEGFSPIPGGGELAGLQYTEGLKLQRYETFVEGRDIHRMEYDDPNTASILDEFADGTISNTPQYLEIIAKHPATMAEVFLRHAVNGFDDRYSTPYVENVDPPGRIVFRVLGFVLVFLAGFRIFWPRGRRSLGPARWRYPTALLACCLTSLPSAVETRFMLPAFVLAVMVVVAPGWPNPLEDRKSGVRRYRTIAVGMVAAVIWLFVVVAITRSATDNLSISRTVLRV
jgi:hypothetical protein